MDCSKKKFTFEIFVTDGGTADVKSKEKKEGRREGSQDL